MKHGKLRKAERVVVQNMRSSVQSLKNLCNFIFFRVFRMTFIPWKRYGCHGFPSTLENVRFIISMMLEYSLPWQRIVCCMFPMYLSSLKWTPSLQSFAMVPVSASWYMLYKAILRISIPVLVTSPTCCWHFFLGRISKQWSLMAWKHQQLANHATE